MSVVVNLTDILSGVILVAALYGVFASYRSAYNAGVRKGLHLAQAKKKRAVRPAPPPTEPMTFANQEELSKALAAELNKKKPDQARLDQLIALNNANRKSNHAH